MTSRRASRVLLTLATAILLLSSSSARGGAIHGISPDLSESEAQDTLVSYVRIYADSDGESHFEDVAVDLNLIEVAPGIAPLFASPFFDASRFAFLEAEPGWREDWHPAPQRQFLVYLEGVTEFKVSDGEVRRLGPGTILLAEDTIGKGHISEVVGDRNVLAVLIQAGSGG